VHIEDINIANVYIYTYVILCNIIYNYILCINQFLNLLIYHHLTILSVTMGKKPMALMGTQVRASAKGTPRWGGGGPNVWLSIGTFGTVRVYNQNHYVT
jgi:hypothetical protein